MKLARRDVLAQGVGMGLSLAAGTRVYAQAISPVPIKIARTKVLDIGYHESGPATGFPVFLLHGFPDDAHAYDGVAPILAGAGFRAIAVYLRGYGPTRFLDAATPRMAEQAALAQDIIDLADALKIKRFAVAGFDWGGRAGLVAAALNPARVRAVVQMSGYTIQNTVTPGAPNFPPGSLLWWWPWYYSTDDGRRAFKAVGKGLCKLFWYDLSPTWHFSHATYELTAASFDNPDFVDCVIHNYRHRSWIAPGEARFLEVEKKLAERPKVDVPTVLLYGGDDGTGRAAADVTPLEREKFPKLVARRIIEGAGHFLPHEKPAEVAAGILESLKATA